MSDYEINKGRLTPIEDIASYAMTFYPELGYDYAIDKMIDDDTIIEINGQWYGINWETSRGAAYDGFAFVEKCENGAINFHTLHYNGGAHWSEVVAGELE